jgi:hypothetical protein
MSSFQDKYEHLFVALCKHACGNSRILAVASALQQRVDKSERKQESWLSRQIAKEVVQELEEPRNFNRLTAGRIRYLAHILVHKQDEKESLASVGRDIEQLEMSKEVNLYFGPVKWSEEMQRVIKGLGEE